MLREQHILFTITVQEKQNNNLLLKTLLKTFKKIINL